MSSASNKIDLVAAGKRLLQKSLETIDFQKDNFGGDIEAIVTKLIDEIKTGTSDAQLMKDASLKALEALIKKRLGLTVSIITNRDLASVMPFYSNKNHIFIHKYWRGNFDIPDQTKLLKESVGRQGTVDLAKAKVGGIFSEYKVTVNLNFHLMVEPLNLTPAEITGVILHELGHAFGVCEYSDRLESINIALSNIATSVIDKKEKDLKFVYRELKSVNDKVTEQDVEELFSENRVIAGTKWFSVIVGTVRSNLGNDAYDRTGFEYLADSFVTRFGYGKQAVIALDKLHTFMGDPAKSKLGDQIFQIISLLAFIYYLAMITLMMTLGLGFITLGLIFSFFFGLILFASGDNVRDMTYDDLKQRYIRVRNNLVERLKDREIEGDEAKVLLDDIEMIDAVIKETYNSSTVWNKLSNFIFKSNREAKNSIQEQQLLEELASNSLFIQAAKFNYLNG